MSQLFFPILQLLFECFCSLGVAGSVIAPFQGLNTMTYDLY